MFNTYARAHASSILISFHILENARADTHVNIPFLFFRKFLSNVDESWFLYIYIYFLFASFYANLASRAKIVLLHSGCFFLFVVVIIHCCSCLRSFSFFFPRISDITYIYIRISIYIYTYIHVYIYICICVRLNRYSLIRYNTSI